MKGNEKEIPVQSEEVLDTTVGGVYMETFPSLLIYLRMKNSKHQSRKIRSAKVPIQQLQDEMRNTWK